ncbi:hypothetical protein FB451DRAFT_1170335 [Mycena latifolia]|nr:hypothetical protein FB451DRAFT_1170335 [Mycena latifolia]
MLYKLISSAILLLALAQGVTSSPSLDARLVACGPGPGTAHCCGSCMSNGQGGTVQYWLVKPWALEVSKVSQSSSIVPEYESTLGGIFPMFIPNIQIDWNCVDNAPISNWSACRRPPMLQETSRTVLSRFPCAGVCAGVCPTFVVNSWSHWQSYFSVSLKTELSILPVNLAQVFLQGQYHLTANVGT